MKLLTGLVLAQLVLIALLFARVAGLESSLDEAVNSAPPVDRGPPRTSLTPLKPAPVAAFDEQRLRDIIREELAAATPPANRGTASVVAAEPDPQQEIEYDYRLEEVRQTLDFYSQTGRISPEQMARLQADIAKLRPSDRTAMLGRLVRELNNGAIDGRL